MTPEQPLRAEDPWWGRPPEFDMLKWPRKSWHIHVDEDGLHIMPVYRGGQFGCRLFTQRTLGL